MATLAPLPMAEVNMMPATAADDLFRRCIAVQRWARELTAARPFTSVAALLDRADELSAALSDDEVRMALADHPRIGERAAATSPTVAMSATEQSDLDARDVALTQRLAAANAAYERRFGHIYLVCASGRSGADLVADLESRMRNDPTTELGVVRIELGRIARVRLGTMVA